MEDRPLAWFKTLRTLLYDAYWPPFHPRLDYDPGRGVAVAKAMGANAIRFGTIGKWALFQSQVMPRHPDLGGRDLLADTLSAARREGIKVIAYVPVGHGLPRTLVEGDRPTWAYVLDDGSLPAGSRHFGGPEVVPVCTFGPYRNDILAVLREVVSHDIDGLYIDGPYQGWIFGNTLCQCPACKRLFKERTGLDLPTNAELAAQDAASRERLAAHVGFVADGLAALLAEIRAIASSKNLPLLFNACAMEYLGAERQSSLAELADGFLVESAMGGIKGIGKGLRHDQIIWTYTRRHSCWPRLSEPEDEARDAVSALLSTAQGATPIVSYAGRFLYDSSTRGPMAETFRYLTSIEGVQSGARPVRHCAILCPSGLRGNATWEDGHHSDDEAVLAAYDLLRAAGIQCVAMPRDLLADPRALAEYAFAFLPSFDALSAAETETLQAYVKAGGGLLATGCRLLAAVGNRAANAAALRTLFGVRAVEPGTRLHALDEHFRWDQARSAPWDCYLRCRESAFAGAPRFADRSLPLGEYAFAEAMDGTAVLADFLLGGDGQGKTPGIFEQTLGKGKAIFAASSLELTWKSSGSALLGELVGTMARRVSAIPWSYDVKGATGIFVNLFETAENGLAVHLVDTDPARASATFDLEVFIPAARRAKSARCVSEGHDRGFVQDGNALRFAQHTIRRGEVLHIEFERSSQPCCR
jgi:hypothetical protein